MPSLTKSSATRGAWVTAAACSITLLSTVAMAGLKEKPPKGVDLTGNWQLDPYRSDDPTAVLDQARAEMQEKRGSGGGRGGMRRGGGGFPGGGSGYPGGGGTYPGGDGGGFPGGGGGFPAGGGGGYGRHGGMGHGGYGGARGNGSGGSGASGAESPRQLLDELAANPDRLAFSTAEHTLKVAAGDANTECAAGVKVAISDANGDAERHCGWDGRAWVIETARGRNFTRTDRYELSKDGKTLTYVTTATGSRMPKVKISRTYTIATAAAG
jgi:hypothetical protein